MKTGRRTIAGMTLKYLMIYTAVFILMSLFIFETFWSGGKSFVWGIDGWSQHFKAMQFYSDWLQSIVKGVIENHRLIIPLWSECIGYGSDIITTLHYYVAGDPLCLLSVFVPDKYMVHFYDGLILLRLYLAGITFSVFCLYQKSVNNKIEGIIGLNAKNRNDRIVGITGMLAGTFVYLFSSYTLIMGIHHPYFLNPFIYLPLILIGAEKILQDKSPVLFIIMVFISAVSNFYFFYMIGFNVIFYVCIRLLSLYGFKGIKEIINKIIHVAVCAVIGICLSAAMLLPVLQLLMRTNRMGNNEVKQFFYPAEFYKSLPDAFFSMTPSEGYHVMMGFSFIVFLSILVLFLNRKKNTELKGGLFFLSALLCLPMAGKILNGFSYPSNRWMFGYILLVSVIVVTQWRNIFRLKGKKLAAAGSILLMFAAVFLNKTGKTSMTRLNFRWIAGFLLAALAVMLIFRMRNMRTFAVVQPVIFCLLVLCSVGVNGYSCYRGDREKANDYKTIAEAKNDLIPAADKAVKSAAGEDKTFWRYTAPAELIQRNSTVVSGLRSTHFYWSLADKIPQQFFTEMKMNNKQDYNYKGLDDRTILNTLVNIKYYAVQEQEALKVPYGYEEKDRKSVETTQGTEQIAVYENKFALPFGYTYSTYMDRETYAALSEIQREDALLQGVLLEKDLPGYQKIQPQQRDKKMTWKFVSGKDAAWDGKAFTVKKKGARVVLSINGKMDNCETYVLFEGMNFKGKKKKEIALKVISSNKDGELIDNKLVYLTKNHPRSTGRKDFLLNVGWDKQNKKEIILEFPYKGKYTFDDISIFCQSMEGYEQSVNQLKEECLENVQIEANRISGQIHLDKEKILCLTIPYSKGWTAWVDGKKMELLRANTMFTGLPLSQGEHRIVLTYWTPGLTAGIILSFTGIILFCLLMVKRKKNNSKTML